MISNGLEARSDYPFLSAGGQLSDSCHADNFQAASKVQAYRGVPICDEEALKDAVARAPVAVGISGYCDAFMSYSGGIMTTSCSPHSTYDTCSSVVDHAVTIVGYGTDPNTGIDYWVIKNSWGTSWGKRTYMHTTYTHAYVRTYIHTYWKYAHNII